MVQCNIQNFQKICKSIHVNDTKNVNIPKIPVLQSATDGSMPGFCSSLVMISKKFNQQHLLGSSIEEQALVRQWLDYSVASVNYVDLPHVSRQVLKDINATLAERTFIAGNFLSLADVVLYHLLFGTMSNLTFQEKEQFMHLSRWYSNLQQNCDIRGSNNLLMFSRTPLYGS